MVLFNKIHDGTSRKKSFVIFKIAEDWRSISLAYVFYAIREIFPMFIHRIRQWHSAVSVSSTQTHLGTFQGACVETSPPHTVCYIPCTLPSMGLFKEISQGRNQTPCCVSVIIVPFRKPHGAHRTHKHTLQWPSLWPAHSWQSRSSLTGKCEPCTSTVLLVGTKYRLLIFTKENNRHIEV